MTIQDAMHKRRMSMYRLAKESEVPYATLNDIVNGRTRLEKCSAETIYRLSRSQDVSMEDLIAPYLLKRPSFENFKSTVCHRVKSMGDIAFIVDTLDRQDIRNYYEKKWYPESLYLLAMLDYLSRENDLPICNEYDDLRQCKLEKPVYPAGVRAISAAMKNDTAMKRAAETAIPEFARFNIIENEVRNVV